MNFFKKLFSSGKEIKTAENNFQGIYSEAYFKERYTEDDIYKKPEILDGCLKMIESYFLENKVQRKKEKPVNHPVNLDQVIADGMGFHTYCKGFNFDDSQIILFLALALSDFLISTYGFKLYKDKQPEFPLRSMTLKYDKNSVFLSLYPFEYSLKALNQESTFEALRNKINTQMESMPQINEVVQKFTNTSNK